MFLDIKYAPIKNINEFNSLETEITTSSFINVNGPTKKVKIFGHKRPYRRSPPYAISIKIIKIFFTDQGIKIKKIFVIGLAYDSQIVRCIPIENHDEKMDIIITDKYIYR